MLIKVNYQRSKTKKTPTFPVTWFDERRNLRPCKGGPTFQIPSFTALFPLMSLRKNDVPKMKKKNLQGDKRIERWKALKGILIFKGALMQI